MPRGIRRTPEPWEWRKTKKCAKCGQTKPWAKFAPHSYNQDGSVRNVAHICHACDVLLVMARQVEYRARNIERIKAYKAAWARAKRRKPLEQPVVVVEGKGTPFDQMTEEEAA